MDDNKKIGIKEFRFHHLKVVKKYYYKSPTFSP